VIGCTLPSCCLVQYFRGAICRSLRWLLFASVQGREYIDPVELRPKAPPPAPAADAAAEPPPDVDVEGGEADTEEGEAPPGASSPLRLEAGPAAAGQPPAAGAVLGQTMSVKYPELYSWNAGGKK